MCAKSLSRVQLFATLWIIAARLLVCGVLQARILEWVVMPPSKVSSRPWPVGSLPLAPPGKPKSNAAAAKSNASVHIKRPCEDTKGETQTRLLCDHSNRDQSRASTSQGGQGVLMTAKI